MDRRIAVAASLVVLAAGYLFFGSHGDAKAAIKQPIRVSGAWALYPMMVKWAEEYQKINQDVEIRVDAGGAGKGMADTLNGLVEIGMISRDIDPSETQKGAYPVRVAKDAVIPTFNKKNPVANEILKRGVRRNQFNDIFVNGNLTKWGDVVGKPDVTNRILVFTRSDSCGAAEIWAKYLGAKQEDLKGIGVYGDPGLLETAKMDPLGVGYNNFS